MAVSRLNGAPCAGNAPEKIPFSRVLITAISRTSNNLSSFQIFCMLATKCAARQTSARISLRTYRRSQQIRDDGSDRTLVCPLLTHFFRRKSATQSGGWPEKSGASNICPAPRRGQPSARDKDAIRWNNSGAIWRRAIVTSSYRGRRLSHDPPGGEIKSAAQRAGRTRRPIRRASRFQMTRNKPIRSSSDHFRPRSARRVVISYSEGADISLKCLRNAQLELKQIYRGGLLTFTPFCPGGGCSFAPWHIRPLLLMVLGQGVHVFWARGRCLRPVLSH